MHRIVKNAGIAILSLAAGVSCAGRLQIASQPAPAATAVAAAPVAPEPVPAVLPIHQFSQFSLSELMPAKAFAASEPATEPCDLLKKIADFRSETASVSLGVGSKEYRYTEVRNSKKKALKDYDIDILLALFQPETCTIRSVPVTKRGNDLVTPSGYDIRVVQRPNGIRWNGWNTAYHISEPANWVVVGNQYPYVTTVKGKRSVRNIFYVPYSKDLAALPQAQQLVRAGLSYATDLARRAFADLRKLGVMSRAIDNTLVSDVQALALQDFVYRMAIEHMDWEEFTLDSEATANRVFMLIGANGDQFGSFTCSPVGACGSLQFMPATYNDMRHTYPAANLIKDTVTGRQDALNIMKAAILLDDSNLAALTKALGPGVFGEQRASSFNTGAVRTINVSRIADQKGLPEWMDGRGKRCTRGTKYAECLLDETKGYISKLRYLMTEWPSGNAGLAEAPTH